METKKYLVPPKLQSKLLLSGLTVPELAIAFVVGLFGFFSSSKLNAVLWTGTWMLCVARLFSGKSLIGIIKLMLSYHFISPQQYIRRKHNEKIKH